MPQVTTSALTGASLYEQVICDVRVNSTGDVQVAAGKPFVGRIEIAWQAGEAPPLEEGEAIQLVGALNALHVLSPKSKDRAYKQRDPPW